MQVPVWHAGDDAVTDGEPTVAAGSDFVLPDVAGGLEEPVGEPVELVAHGVAPIHDGVLAAGLVGGPPAGEGLAVEVELVVDDVEVSGGVEAVERGGDVAGPQGVGGGAVVGIPHPVSDSELGGVGGVMMAEDAEHAAGFDGAVLSGIADEPQAGTGVAGEPAEPVEVAVGDGGGFVDDADGAGGLAFDGGADDSPARGLPGVAGGGHGGGFAGTGAADGALDAVSAGAEGAYELALLVGELWLPGKGLIDGGGGDEGGAAGGAGGDQQRLGLAVVVGDREVDEGGEDVGPVEDRQVGTDPVGCGERGVQRRGVGFGQFEGAVEAGGELVAPEAEGRGAGAPAVEQLVDGDVLFGGPGLEHDPVELVEVGVVADGVFELA